MRILEPPVIKCIPPCLKKCNVREGEGIGWSSWKECTVWRIPIYQAEKLFPRHPNSKLRTLKGSDSPHPVQLGKLTAKSPLVVAVGNGEQGAELSGEMQRVCGPQDTKREVERKGPSCGAGQTVLYPKANEKPGVLLPMVRWGREGSKERNKLCKGWHRGGDGGRKGIF